MKQHTRKIYREPVSERSTLLVGRMIYYKSMRHSKVRGKTLKEYLHYLLSDFALDFKLSVLQSGKWKKVYQDEGHLQMAI